MYAFLFRVAYCVVVTIEFILLLLTEYLNTAIEDIVDYVAKNKKFQNAKKSKDIASVTVSIVSFNMGMVSYILFYRNFKIII